MRSVQQTAWLGVAVMVGALAASGLRADVVIVQDGRPQATIVLPQKPSENEKLAANELQKHIELISGAKLPIVEAKLGQQIDFPILIGDTAPLFAGGSGAEKIKEKSADPAALRETLGRAFTVLGRVVKGRRLYLVDRTRVHLDRVEGLGSFVELEVVLRDDEAPEDGMAVARKLLDHLGIAEDQLVTGAYLDLLGRV